MKRLPKVIPGEELEKLSTSRLLAYLMQLNQCEESFENSDGYVNLDLDSEISIQFKQSEKWKQAHFRVKSILDKREHINKKSL